MSYNNIQNISIRAREDVKIWYSHTYLHPWILKDWYSHMHPDLRILKDWCIRIRGSLNFFHSIHFYKGGVRSQWWRVMPCRWCMVPCDDVLCCADDVWCHVMTCYVVSIMYGASDVLCCVDDVWCQWWRVILCRWSTVLTNFKKCICETANTQILEIPKNLLQFHACTQTVSKNFLQ